MTKEEAAEILLAGPKNTDCTRCKGKGWVHGEIKEGTPLTLCADGYIEARSVCAVCSGRGYFPDQEHLLAQIVIEIDIAQTEPVVGAFIPYGKAIEAPKPTTTPGKMCVWVKPDFNFSSSLNEKRCFMVYDGDD